MAKENKGLPSRIRLSQDLEQKISEFMKKQNRPFPNAVDELLRIAFGRITEAERREMELLHKVDSLEREMKKRMKAIEKIELHEHGVGSPERDRFEGKKNDNL